MINGDSGFDSKQFSAAPYLKLIEDKGGTTCLCYQMHLHGKLHFVKKIRPEYENDARMRAAFRKENELGFSLSHPNIPRYVFMEGIFSPEEYVVTEWIEGQPLDKFLENNPSYFSDRKNIKRFIYQLTAGLDYLHRNGIIHGDLKPSNIMLTSDGSQVMIIDLGFAFTGAHRLSVGFSHQFASPEVLGGKTPEIIDDYYSLAKIIRYLQTNSRLCIDFPTKRVVDHLLLSDQRNRSQYYNKLKTWSTTTRDYHRSFLFIFLFVLACVGAGFWLTFFYAGKTYNNDIENEFAAASLASDSTLENLGEDKAAADTYSGPLNTTMDKEQPLTSVASEKPSVNYEDSVAEETRRRIRTYYYPVVATIDSLSSKGIYTREWRDTIFKRSSHAVIQCCDAFSYAAMYPQVKEERIPWIIAREHQKYLDSEWNPKYKDYFDKVVQAIKEER